MPTKRAWIFLTLALILYFLANQTQVGWVYIIADGLVGLLIAAFFFTWRGLASVQAKRRLRMMSPASMPAPDGPGHDSGTAADEAILALPAFYEDNLLEVTLHFSNTSRKPVLLLTGQESCPFALAVDQRLPFFIPVLFKGQSTYLSYQVNCDRRGLYTFPEIILQSRGAFGLFRTKRVLAAPDQVLIYPSYYRLKQLHLLERQELAERQATKTGAGSQVIGTREYRSGDSSRHIHWRSTARLGKLVIKEFADDEQTALTVVLDLAAHSSVGTGKFSTFETAIRIAASLAYYAGRRSLPFYLVAASRVAEQRGRKWDLPSTPLGWWTVLNYLAKVNNDGNRLLAQVLSNLPAGQPGRPDSAFVVVLISKSDPALTKALLALQQKGTRTLAVFITIDGSPPPDTETLKVAGLAVQSVSPYNWATIMAE